MGSTDKLRKASKARAPAKLRGAPDSQLKVMGSTGTLRKASKARARPKLREVPESQLEATESTNKLMEASMALLQGAPDSQLNIVVLNKALFYLDLIALRDFGRTITGERYVALPQGPMVADYARKIVHALEVAGLAEQLEMERSKPLRVKKRLAEFMHLSDSEVLLATDLARTVSPFTSTMLIDFSHRNSGWILAYKNTMNGGPAAEINMHIAMQQIAWALDNADDDWMNTPPDESLAQELEQAQHAVHIWE